MPGIPLDQLDDRALEQIESVAKEHNIDPFVFLKGILQVVRSAEHSTKGEASIFYTVRDYAAKRGASLEGVNVRSIGRAAASIMRANDPAYSFKSGANGDYRYSADVRRACSDRGTC